MNITELRLLAYKKRNWQYTFLRLAPLHEKISLDKNQLKVNIFEKDSFVIVQSESKELLQAAATAVFEVTNVNPYVEFYISDTYLLDNKMELQLMVRERAYMSGRNQDLLVSYLTNELTVAKNNRFSGYSHLELAANFKTLMRSAELVKINTYMTGLLVDATGSLDTAKVARLKDYGAYSLNKINQDYNTWFDTTTLKKLHYSLY